MLVSNPGSSLLRILEYESLRGIPLTGTTLDIGGGRRSGYYHLFSVHGEIQAVNLDPGMDPTYIADLNAGIPAASDSYANVISLNTLEHVWQDVFLLQETFRVLKPGGQVILIVPFIYRVHGSASCGDYHRRTLHFWTRMLEEIGFARDWVQIELLTFGPLAAPLSLMEYIFFVPCVRAMVRACVLSASMLWAGLRPKGERSSGSDAPLGYLIRVCK
jgi:SAM-dependent methyltransferase